MSKTLPDSHVAIALASLRPDEELPADIFLYINEKFIKYKKTGEVLPASKYDYFLSKSLKEIFVEASSEALFTNWVTETKKRYVEESVQNIGEEHRPLAEKKEEIRDIIYEVFADKEMDASLVEHLQNNVESFLNRAKDLKESKTILAKLNKQRKSLTDHSVNVANLSVFLTMVMGFGGHETLMNVYMGALLHDYGKAKIPATVLEDPTSNMYKQAMEFHPLKGAKAAREIVLNEKVATIVEQHHEQFNGQGYPNKLSGEEILDLAQIVSIANIFDNLCDENAKKSEREKYKSSIKVIEYDRGKLFNPSFVDRCVQALKLVYLESD